MSAGDFMLIVNAQKVVHVDTGGCGHHLALARLVRGAASDGDASDILVAYEEKRMDAVRVAQNKSLNQIKGRLRPDLTFPEKAEVSFEDRVSRARAKRWLKAPESFSESEKNEMMSETETETSESETSFVEILEAAKRRVNDWPEWMRRPEYRIRTPVGNCPVKEKR